jgi:hypothetical protein
MYSFRTLSWSILSQNCTPAIVKEFDVVQENAELIGIIEFRRYWWRGLVKNYA